MKNKKQWFILIRQRRTSPPGGQGLISPRLINSPLLAALQCLCRYPAALRRGSSFIYQENRSTEGDQMKRLIIVAIVLSFIFAPMGCIQYNKSIKPYDPIWGDEGDWDEPDDWRNRYKYP